MTKLYENIKNLCKQKSITINQLEDETGIPKNSLANWDNERRWSTYLPLVAKRLGVSIDCLFYAEDQRNNDAVDKVKSALDTMPIDHESADTIIKIAKIITDKASKKE